jgi:hypothetical protein
MHLANPQETFMDRKERIGHYIQRLSDKKFEIYQVRMELEQQNVDETEIKIIVRAVDDEIQRRLHIKGGKDFTVEFIRIGIILIAIGGLIMMASLTNLVNTKNFLFVTYGPFFVGLSMLFVGLFKRINKKIDNSTIPHEDKSNERQKISFKKRRDP